MKQSPSRQGHHKHRPHAWHKFGKLVNARKGNRVEDIAELKTYFQRFGYYHPLLGKDTKVANFNNEFDDHLEHVVTRYQQNYGLPVTGTFDSVTLFTT